VDRSTNDRLLYDVLSMAYQWRRFLFCPLICRAIKMLIENAFPYRFSLADRLSSAAVAAPENQTRG